MFLNTKKPTAIMFKANYCGHCTAMMPTWKKVRDRILCMNVYTFTIDESEEKRQHIEKINDSLKEGKIEGFPTFLFYRGKEITKLEGEISFEEILEKAKEICL